jgi:hypothetical protein
MTVADHNKKILYPEKIEADQSAYQGENLVYAYLFERVLIFSQLYPNKIGKIGELIVKKWKQPQ